MTILCLALQVCLLVTAKRALRFWLHPVVLLLTLWSALLISTALVAGEYYFSVPAFFILFLLELMSVAGALYGFLNQRFGTPVRRQLRFAGLRPLIWSSFLLGVTSIVSVIHSRGVVLTGLLNPSALLDVTHEFSVARYEDDYRMPLLARASQMFVFFSVIISALDFATNKRLRIWEYFLPFVPLLLTAVVLTTRGTIIYGGIFWFGAFVTGRLWAVRSLSEPLISAKAIIVGAMALVLFTITFVALQFLRGGISDLGRLPEILAHLKKWPFGSFAGFSIWVDKTREAADVSYGYYSFTGLFDLLGIRGREAGLYEKYVDLGNGAYGNIYTAYRGLIEDFSLAGACVGMYLYGAAASLGMSKVLGRRLVGIWLLVCLYPVAIFSPVVNFYVYFGHVAAGLLVLAYLLFFARTEDARRGQVQC